MGILDSIVSSMGAGSPQAGAQASLLPALIELVKNYPGGLQGLIEKFQQGGLGDVIASWIGTGQNQPVSPDQLQSVLGDGIVGNLSEKSGLDVNTVLSSLSVMLPSLVDQATPNGSADGVGGSLLGSLSGLLGKL
ncbi:MAG TPA: YidB family protein [Candidimonas sp.]|nr:YidB family protein [Candidimonas sp.]